MFTNYTNCLPAWSVGPNCYEKVYGVVAKFGKSAAVIGGKTALSKAYGPLQEALAGTDFKLSEPVWYGGNSTYENAAMLESQPAVQEADVIFAVGGGGPWIPARRWPSIWASPSSRSPPSPPTVPPHLHRRVLQRGRHLQGLLLSLPLPGAHLPEHQDHR